MSDPLHARAFGEPRWIRRADSTPEREHLASTLSKVVVAANHAARFHALGGSVLALGADITRAHYTELKADETVEASDFVVLAQDHFPFTPRLTHAYVHFCFSVWNRAAMGVARFRLRVKDEADRTVYQTSETLELDLAAGSADRIASTVWDRSQSPGGQFEGLLAVGLEFEEVAEGDHWLVELEGYAVGQTYELAEFAIPLRLDIASHFYGSIPGGR